VGWKRSQLALSVNVVVSGLLSFVFSFSSFFFTFSLSSLFQSFSQLYSLRVQYVFFVSAWGSMAGGYPVDDLGGEKKVYLVSVRAALERGGTDK
jgi:hypothetical protein